jgi:hypothetical protein
MTKRLSPESFVVAGNVPAMKQPNDNACWITAYTILTGWIEQRAVTQSDILTVATTLGNRWKQLFEQRAALPGGETESFIADAKLERRSLANPSVSGWVDLLKKYGLLWVTVGGLRADGSAWGHAVLLQGVLTDGTESGTTYLVVDPSIGASRTLSSDQFRRMYESWIKEIGTPSGIEVLYHKS